MPVPKSNNHLFHEYQVDGTDDEEEGQYVVPMNVLSLKENVGNNSEDTKRDAFLNHLELNEVERSAVPLESHSVSGNLTAILEESYSPRKDDNSYQWPMAADACLLKLEMPIPSKRHEDVA